MSFLNMDEVFTAYDKKAKYVIHCETCEKKFFESTLEEVAKMIDFNHTTMTWNKRTWSPAKQRWYITAARHWIETELSHKIVLTITENISGILKSHLGYNLSKEWHQGLMLEPSGKRNTQAMLNELNYLEKQVV